MECGKFHACVDRPPPNAAPSIREGKVMPPQNPDLEGTTPIPVWFVGNTETIQKPASGTQA
jgi:hypothetical protein